MYMTYHAHFPCTPHNNTPQCHVTQHAHQSALRPEQYFSDTWVKLGTLVACPKTQVFASYGIHAGVDVTGAEDEEEGRGEEEGGSA